MVSGAFNNDILTIGLSGRIESANAAEVEKEIFSLRDKYPFGAIEIDAAGLEYISSAGLRILMKLKKHEAQMAVNNVSAAVYDVFEVTGFNQMMVVRRAPRKISLAGCQVIGQSAGSVSYRYDSETLVKLFDKKVTLDEAQLERDKMQQAMILGIPTAIAYDVVECGGQYGLMYEMVNAKTLGEALETEPEKFDEYVRLYAELLASIHETSDDIGTFPAIKEQYLSCIDNIEEYLEADETAVIREIIDAACDGDCLVHGGFHPGNIMVKDGELLLIDAAELGAGDPFFDFAAIYRDVAALAKEDIVRLKKVTGLGRESALRLWDGLIRYYFDTDSATAIGKANQLYSLGASLSKAIMLGRKESDPAENINASINDIRTELIPNAEALISLFETRE